MDFPRDIFGPLSEEVVGLIKGLTKTDPSERLSCADALSHTWLAVGAQQTEALPEAAREAAQARARPFATSSGRCAGSRLRRARRRFHASPPSGERRGDGRASGVEPSSRPVEGKGMTDPTRPGDVW